MGKGYTVWSGNAAYYFITNTFGRIIYAKFTYTREDIDAIPWSKYPLSKEMSKTILTNCEAIKQLSDDELILELL